MDNKGIIVFCILFGIFIITTFMEFVHKYTKEPVIQTDTVLIYVTDSTAMKQVDSLYNVIYSIEKRNEVYDEELNIALFKLNRIKEYNAIAAKDNNIIFLRGWINRVLNSRMKSISSSASIVVTYL